MEVSKHVAIHANTIKQEVGDNLSVYVLNLDLVTEKIKIKRKNFSYKLLHQEHLLAMFDRS